MHWQTGGLLAPGPAPAPPRTTDPWADFNQENKKSFYSSSDSDSDDEEVKKIKTPMIPNTPSREEVRQHRITHRPFSFLVSPLC